MTCESYREGAYERDGKLIAEIIDIVEIAKYESVEFWRVASKPKIVWERIATANVAAVALFRKGG